VFCAVATPARSQIMLLISVAILVALLGALIPTTSIGGLLMQINYRMDKVAQFNVIATSGPGR